MNDRTSTIKQKLTLIQLADSFFPSETYTFSHGLEALVQQDRVQQPEDIVSFLQILLHNKIATCDLVALIHAYRASKANDIEAVKQVETQLYAQTLIEITRKTQQQSGRALLMVAQSTAIAGFKTLLLSASRCFWRGRKYRRFKRDRHHFSFFAWLCNGGIGCSNSLGYFGTFARARDAATFSLRYRTSI